jgi:hypothetical protein
VRGYWIDPATGLMWAGKDNGKDVYWRKARKYCRNLRLGGYSDWRLATIEELQGIYDKNANAPQRGHLAQFNTALISLLAAGTVNLTFFLACTNRSNPYAMKHSIR